MAPTVQIDTPSNYDHNKSISDALLYKGVFNGMSPLSSFNNQSASYAWEMGNGNWFGLIAGFGIFGIMYLYTFVAIIIDINKRYEEYRGLVE